MVNMVHKQSTELSSYTFDPAVRATIREKNVGTLIATVVGPMQWSNVSPFPQINVGWCDVYSRQAYGPNIIEWRRNGRGYMKSQRAKWYNIP